MSGCGKGLKLLGKISRLICPQFSLKKSSRFSALSGGGCPWEEEVARIGPHIDFRIESENERTVTLRLSNYLDKQSVYLFVRREDSTRSRFSSPYFLECLTPGSLRSIVTSQSFGGEVHQLYPGQYIELDVPKPNTRSRCWVSIPVDDDPAEIDKLNYFQPTDWKDFDQTVRRHMSTAFHKK